MKKIIVALLAVPVLLLGAGLSSGQQAQECTLHGGGIFEDGAAFSVRIDPCGEPETLKLLVHDPDEGIITIEAEGPEDGELTIRCVVAGNSNLAFRIAWDPLVDPILAFREVGGEVETIELRMEAFMLRPQRSSSLEVDVNSEIRIMSHRPGNEGGTGQGWIQLRPCRQ